MRGGVERCVVGFLMSPLTVTRSCKVGLACRAAVAEKPQYAPHLMPVQIKCRHTEKQHESDMAVNFAENIMKWLLKA